MDSYLELQRWWAKTQSGIATKAIPEQRIAELEHHYGVVLPNDFRQYIRMSCPVGEAIDRENGTWWEFSRIKNIPDDYPYEIGQPIADRAGEYLLFLDHALWCWAWAIACTNDDNRGKVALIAGAGYDRFVANSFSEFVLTYIKDWKSVSIT